MRNISLKTLLLAAGLGMTALVAGCDNPATYDEVEQIELETAPVTAAAADESAAPAVAEVTQPEVDGPPVESVPLAPQTSEESVQPDSETLFY